MNWLIFLLVVIPFVGYCGGARYCTFSSYHDWSSGSATDVRIWSRGGISPAAAMDSVEIGDEDYIWCMDIDTRGHVFLGTGARGRVYTVADGETNLFFDSPESDILSMTLAGKNDLWIGCSPDGLIYRIHRESRAVEEYVTGQSSVWSLVPHGDGVLAATGPRGKVYYCKPPGEVREFSALPAINVMSLLSLSEDEIYAATESPALVVRIHEDGRFFTVGRMDYMELRNLVSLPGDSVAFIGLSPTTPLPRHQAAVLRGPRSGPFEVFWSSPDSVLMELVWKDGMLFAAGGWPGRVYGIEPDRSFHRLAESNRPQVICAVMGSRDTMYLGTGSPACLFSMDITGAQTGTWQSPILDAHQTADWGRVEIIASESCESRMHARSGNLGSPDDGWSPWKELNEQYGGWNIDVPRARYAQFRVEIRHDTPLNHPSVEWLQFSYEPENRSPLITDIELMERGKSPPGVYRSPSRPMVPRTSTDGSTSATSENGRSRNGDGRNDRYLTWKAVDPDNDGLDYSVVCRLTGERRWIMLVDKGEKEYHVIPYGSLADGWYTFQVTVSDLPGNPPEQARTVRRTLGPVMIDDSPPVVDTVIWKDGDGGNTAIVQAYDSMSGLSSAAVSYDGGPWIVLEAGDGITDEQNELFTISGIQPHASMTLRLVDRAGNIASASVHR